MKDLKFFKARVAAFQRELPAPADPGQPLVSIVLWDTYLALLGEIREAAPELVRHLPTPFQPAPSPFRDMGATTVHMVDLKVFINQVAGVLDAAEQQ